MTETTGQAAQSGLAFSLVVVAIFSIGTILGSCPLWLESFGYETPRWARLAASSVGFFIIAVLLS